MSEETPSVGSQLDSVLQENSNEIDHIATKELPVIKHDIVTLQESVVDLNDRIANGSGGSGASGSLGPASGWVHIDSFGGSDDDRLAAAMNQVRDSHYKPTILLGNRRYTFNKPITAFTGLRIQGSGAGIEQHRSGNPFASSVKITTNGTWLTYPTGNTFGTGLTNISFEGTSNTQFAKTDGICWTSTFSNLAFTNFKHVLGSPQKQFLITACTFNGFWNTNNSYDTAYTLGGSDNNLWIGGMLIDSPKSFMNQKSYHIRCAHLSKTNIGPLYMTCEGTSGILITGNANTPGLVFTNTRIEGRNANAPSNGAVVRVNGGQVTFRDCWFAYGVKNPSVGANASDRAIVHIAGGDVLISGGMGANASGVNTPLIARTGGNLIVSDTRMTGGNVQ